MPSVPITLRELVFPTPRGHLPGTVATPSPDTPTRGNAVLVGGFLIGRGMWTPAMRRLARHGYRVCAYDHLGVTSGPDDPDAYSVTALADDLLAIIDQFAGEQPVHLVGSCFGGFVARSAALTTGKRALSLTLLASGPSMHESSDPEFASWWAERALGSGHEGLWQVMSGWMPPRPEGLSRSGEIFRRNFLATKVGYLAGFPRSVALSVFPERRLRDLNIPKLVAFGDHDNVWEPAVQRSMADRIDAHSVTISGAKHAPLLDRPATTAAVIRDFLDHADTSREGVPA